MKVQNSQVHPKNTHTEQNVIRSVCVWLHTYNQHATSQTMALCPLSILEQVLCSMSHILERTKEYLGSADMYALNVLVHLKPFYRGRYVQYTIPATLLRY